MTVVVELLNLVDLFVVVVCDYEVAINNVAALFFLYEYFCEVIK